MSKKALSSCSKCSHCPYFVWEQGSILMYNILGQGNPLKTANILTADILTTAYSPQTRNLLSINKPGGEKTPWSLLHMINTSTAETCW